MCIYSNLEANELSTEQDITNVNNQCACLDSIISVGTMQRQITDFFQKNECEEIKSCISILVLLLLAYVELPIIMGLVTSQSKIL